MDLKADELRKRLAELPTRGNRRQYTAAVKKAVLEFLDHSVAEGQSEAASCRAIGMHQATVSKWRLGTRRRVSTTRSKAETKSRFSKRVLPVEVNTTRTTMKPLLTLTLPGGARVEGLEFSQVLELAKALR